MCLSLRARVDGAWVLQGGREERPSGPCWVRLLMYPNLLFRVVEGLARRGSSVSRRSMFVVGRGDAGELGARFVNPTGSGV